MISIIIPTLNESRALPATLQNLLLQIEGHEIIVVDGGSVDTTCDIVRHFKHIKILTAPRGRASQMNVGAAQANGEWLLFLHADTLLPANALARIDELPETIQAGGFKHRFSGEAWGLRLISWLHNFRCRRTLVFYGDQALFIRRSLFEKIGGFPDVPILEDLLFGEQLRKATEPTILDDYVTTDSRKFEQMGIWLSLWRVVVILSSHELGLQTRSLKFFASVR